ncbi:hypothetical protein ACFZAR_19395 [Streptomyces sp. NPDC008222]|uniref:hypothetical protein n=1 Tax=Streptomyces sp. NPDC008222 TaxID=3364820 RepID=UPI0036E38398
MDTTTQTAFVAGSATVLPVLTVAGAVLKGAGTTVLRTRLSATPAIPRVSGAMTIVKGGFLPVERLAG